MKRNFKSLIFNNLIKDTRTISNFEKHILPTTRNRDLVMLKLRKSLSKNYDSRTINNIYDYQKSSGNFIVDVDRNRYIDMFCNIASVPIGYNHPKLLEQFTKQEYLHLLLHRNSLGVMPPIEKHE